MVAPERQQLLMLVEVVLVQIGHVRVFDDVKVLAYVVARRGQLHTVPGAQLRRRRLLLLLVCCGCRPRLPVMVIVVVALAVVLQPVVKATAAQDHGRRTDRIHRLLLLLHDTTSPTAASTTASKAVRHHAAREQMLLVLLAQERDAHRVTKSTSAVMSRRIEPGSDGSILCSGISPTAAMYVLPTVLILSIAWNRSSHSSSSKSAMISFSSRKHSTPWFDPSSSV
uniref:Uncharacterized protein n=1 Tax=Anopheles coluzzii TaxID=1518534 RepID=A0A8W7PUS8_ANOCL